MKTILGFIDESGTISEIFYDKKRLASFALVIFEDEKYAYFKKEWLNLLKELFKEIFENIKNKISDNPLELYEIGKVLDKLKPRMEFHTSDVLHHEGIYKYLNSGSEIKYLERFCDLILKYVSNIYVLIVTKDKTSSIPSKSRTRCNDTEVSTPVITKFVNKVIEREDFNDKLFIVIIDGESYAVAQGGGRYSYRIVDELLSQKYFEDSSHLSKLVGLSVLFAQSHHEVGIQGADLVAFVARRYKEKHKGEKEIDSKIGECYEKMKRKLRVLELRLSSCNEEEVKDAQIREAER